MNKLLSLLLVLLFTQSCSFKPMLADKSYNFKFVNIKFEGDRNINQILNQELKDISKGTFWISTNNYNRLIFH